MAGTRCRARAGAQLRRPTGRWPALRAGRMARRASGQSLAALFLGRMVSDLQDDRRQCQQYQRRLAGDQHRHPVRLGRTGRQGDAGKGLPLVEPSSIQRRKFSGAMACPARRRSPSSIRSATSVSYRSATPVKSACACACGGRAGESHETALFASCGARAGPRRSSRCRTGKCASSRRRRRHRPRPGQLAGPCCALGRTAAGRHRRSRALVGAARHPARYAAGRTGNQRIFRVDRNSQKCADPTERITRNSA